MKMSDQDIALAFGVPLARARHRRRDPVVDRAADAAVDRQRPRLCAQPYRGGVRRVVPAARRARGIHRVLDARRCCARPTRTASRAWRAACRAASTRPDEARAEEELPRVPGGYGDEPRVQQQVVPLSRVGEGPGGDCRRAAAARAAGAAGRGGGRGRRCRKICSCRRPPPHRCALSTHSLTASRRRSPRSSPTCGRSATPRSPELDARARAVPCPLRGDAGALSDFRNGRSPPRFATGWRN